jgi:hypothetical protein
MGERSEARSGGIADFSGRGGLSGRSVSGSSAVDSVLGDPGDDAVSCWRSCPLGRWLFVE